MFGYHIISKDGKRVRAHRAIMEGILGRTLNKSEVVHHKNGNKVDNRPENLEVMSRAEHDFVSMADALISLAKRFPSRVQEVKNKILREL